MFVFYCYTSPRDFPFFLFDFFVCFRASEKASGSYLPSIFDYLMGGSLCKGCWSLASSTRNANIGGHQGSLQSIGRRFLLLVGRGFVHWTGTATGNRTDRLVVGKGRNLRKDRQVKTIRSSAAASKGSASVDTRHHHHHDADQKNQGNLAEEMHHCRHIIWSSKIVNLKSGCDSFWIMLGICCWSWLRLFCLLT